MNERERLLKIMESEGMNAKQFSSEVGISQGTLSNIIGGRNRPSLEVMQQVLNRFRTIQSDWLILGVGSMYRTNGDGPQTSLFDIRPNDVLPSVTVLPERNTEQQTDIQQENKQNVTKRKQSDSAASADSQTVGVKQVRRIIVFYTDGTYEER